MIDQLQDTAGTESRTYTCFCGAELIIEFREEDDWSDRETGTLDSAGWVLRGREYRCPIHARDEP